ncbi:MAG: hypothetical protein IK081_01995 [Lachnospiraceae bacterium]|nr:hypothetical protein [Lachnospiraceae bacterium]
MKRLRTYLFLLFPLLLCLAACGNKGKLDEGDCAGVVTFSNIPKEFSLLDENLQKEYAIHVTLKNLTTEKEYSIHLNQKNDFKKTVSLHPGKYSVRVSASLDSLVHLQVKATEEIVTFDRGVEANVIVIPENAEEFSNYWMQTHPQAEILTADKFSRLIQVNRKIMTIKDIVTELDLSDMDKVLEGAQKTTLTDNERGVSITLLNTMSTPQPLSKCEVVSLSVTKNTVVFPDGVTLGLAPDKVCHKQTGLYGEPTRFEGMYLFGWGLDETKAIYWDPISNDQITIEFSPSGDSITRITYEILATK